MRRERKRALLGNNVHDEGIQGAGPSFSSRLPHIVLLSPFDGKQRGERSGRMSEDCKGEKKWDMNKKKEERMEGGRRGREERA